MTEHPHIAMRLLNAIGSAPVADPAALLRILTELASDNSAPPQMGGDEAARRLLRDFIRTDNGLGAHACASCAYDAKGADEHPCCKCVGANWDAPECYWALAEDLK
jgi:hypothetical protein